MDTTKPDQEVLVTPRSLAWLGALPLLARHLARTMPWGTLISGCLAGLVFLTVMAHVAETSHSPLTLSIVRVAFLPALAALAFVLRSPFRPLNQVVPVPAWLAQASHILLAAPVLAVTCWAQLRITADTVPSHILGPAPAVYPLVAQLTGWSAVTVTAAAWVDRSRYADLGGAIAAPVTFAAIALGLVLARRREAPGRTARHRAQRHLRVVRRRGRWADPDVRGDAGPVAPLLAPL